MNDHERRVNKINIISFSGGKDSTALILWAKEHLKNFQVVFCDTGWEHEITYEYIKYINEILCNGELIIIKSKKYAGFEDLSYKKKRVASTKARFCTQELKIFPMHDYIHSLSHKVRMFVGIRAEESHSRAKMPMANFDMDYYGCWIYRPLKHWIAEQVFNIHKKYDVEPNPLYTMGMKRVGCMPCIMVNLLELRTIIKRFPYVIDNIRRIETKLGRTFFPVDKIPERYRTGYDEKSGKRIAFIDDIIKYLLEVKEDPNQLTLDEPQTCMSFYNICE
jgi:3'-phosphoadenosine 5'-phosphosulfate sulfotransferase (PAPS reductase)/FAD synthetase